MTPYHFPTSTNHLAVLLTEYWTANQTLHDWEFPIHMKIIPMITCPIKSYIHVQSPLKWNCEADKLVKYELFLQPKYLSQPLTILTIFILNIIKLWTKFFSNFNFSRLHFETWIEMVPPPSHPIQIQRLIWAYKSSMPWKCDKLWNLGLRGSDT